MKVLLIFVFVSCFLGAQVTAQSVSYPQDRIYESLETWETAGLISELPEVRPFSTSRVIEALNQVIANEKSPSVQKQIAQEYLLAMYKLHPELGVKFRSDLTSNFLQMGTRFWGQGPISDWLDIAVDARQWILYDKQGLVTTRHFALEEDFVADETSVGSGKDALNIRQSVTSMVDIHPTKEVNLHLGIGRNSIGPFWFNGVVLGPQSPAAGAFTLEWFGEGVSLNLGFFPIIATNNTGGSAKSGKYLYYHQLDIDLIPNLELSVFETVVSGERIEPLYFIPLSAYFNSQGLGGFGDNSLIGFDVNARVVDGLKLAMVMYMDDMHFNDIIRFNFNTKYKFAFQIGGTWTPYVLGDIPWFDNLRLDYTAVMPYMYTHYNSGATRSDFNWENYTNQGKSLGADLEPNSDRLNLTSVFLPNENVKIDFGLQYIRHGNASAGVYSNPNLNQDGSVFDPGFLATDDPTFQAPFNDPTGQPVTRFLTQSIIEQVLKIQLGAELVIWRFDPTLDQKMLNGRLDAKLGYELQVINNETMVAGKLGIKNLLSFSIGFSL